MTSVISRGSKQTNAYFVPVGDCRTSILQYTPGNGAGGAYNVGSFSPASWTTIGQTGYDTNLMSSIATAGAGGIFRDMGKTVVSSGLTFRKVQLIINSPATNGVSGPIVPDAEFLTGYVQLSSGPSGVNSGAAPISMYPSLW